MSSTSDKFKKVGAGTVTTLAAPGKATGATSINVASTTNYPSDTGIVIAIRVVDSDGELVAGTYTEYSAIVTSETALTIVGTPVYGNDQAYSAGTTTQVFVPTSAYAQSTLVGGILVGHGQDGKHSGDLGKIEAATAWASWAPTFVKTDGSTPLTVTVQDARYQVIGSHVRIQVTGYFNADPVGNLFWITNLPVNGKGVAGVYTTVGVGDSNANGSIATLFFRLGAAASTNSAYAFRSTNWASTNNNFSFSAEYEKA